LDISYGDFFEDPNTGPEETETEHRKRAILFTNDMKMYENWIWSKKNKAHFICHSQGGTTVRLLISLMAWGDPRNPTYFGEPGRDDWAISVTTLGTPHKGTTICDVVLKLLSVSSSSKCSTLISHMASLFLSQAAAPVTSTNISVSLLMLVGIQSLISP
jgi:triacylglycerol esterase/lipase EstA (alpha/beta hydrolase family)